MNKRTKALSFDRITKDIIYQRDRGCIFCQMGYMIPEIPSFSQTIFSIMHYIPRSQGGLGVVENGAVGCNYHHHMMDNGNLGNREEMLSMFREYLKQFYDSWDEEKLYYKKWN